MLETGLTVPLILTLRHDLQSLVTAPPFFPSWVSGSAREAIILCDLSIRNLACTARVTWLRRTTGDVQ